LIDFVEKNRHRNFMYFWSKLWSKITGSGVGFSLLGKMPKFDPNYDPRVGFSLLGKMPKFDPNYDPICHISNLGKMPTFDPNS